MAVRSNQEYGEGLPIGAKGSSEIKGHGSSITLSHAFMWFPVSFSEAGKAAKTLLVGINSKLREEGQGNKKFKVLGREWLRKYLGWLQMKTSKSSKEKNMRTKGSQRTAIWEWKMEFWDIRGSGEFKISEVENCQVMIKTRMWHWEPVTEGEGCEAHWRESQGGSRHTSYWMRFPY